MRAAAHHMVRFMTAGMALITCREPLLVSITNTLRSSLQTAFRVCWSLKNITMAQFLESWVTLSQG